MLILAIGLLYTIPILTMCLNPFIDFEKVLHQKAFTILHLNDIITWSIPFVGSFLIRYLFFPSSSFRSFRENEKDNLGISNRKIIFGPLHTNKIGRLFNSIYHSIPWSAIICTRDRVDKMAAKSWHSERGRY